MIHINFPRFCFNAICACSPFLVILTLNDQLSPSLCYNLQPYTTGGDLSDWMNECVPEQSPSAFLGTTNGLILFFKLDSYWPFGGSWYHPSLEGHYAFMFPQKTHTIVSLSENGNSELNPGTGDLEMLMCLMSRSRKGLCYEFPRSTLY